MALTPDPAWSAPASTWDDVVSRYVRSRRVKAWRGRTHGADGTLNPSRITAAQGMRLWRLLANRIPSLITQRMLSTLPNRLRQKNVDLLVSRFAPHRDFAKSPEWLQHLWRAILLNRDCYTCRYCRRTAWDAHRELGAILRFELDHKRPRYRLSKHHDFDLRNIVTACRSCNVIKGQMRVTLFLRELRSLGRAVRRIQHRSGSLAS